MPYKSQAQLSSTETTALPINFGGQGKRSARYFVAAQPIVHRHGSAIEQSSYLREAKFFFVIVILEPFFVRHHLPFSRRKDFLQNLSFARTLDRDQFGYQFERIEAAPDVNIVTSLSRGLCDVFRPWNVQAIKAGFCCLNDVLICIANADARGVTSFCFITTDRSFAVYKSRQI